jgi:peptide/nickel transport system permease protein
MKKTMMIRYIIKRILWCILVLLGVSMISFGIIHLAPGDPARLLLPQDATNEQINLLREEMGLNKPLYIQYFIYIKGAMKGDLGASLYYKMPNLDLIVERAPATIILSAAAMLGACLVAIPLGVIAGVNQGKIGDFFAMFFAILGQSLSTVWFAILLIFIFSVKLRILPSFGYGSLRALILPATSLALIHAALITRLTRAGMIEVLSEDYILAIRAKGIQNYKVLSRYALKNALIPIVTVVGLRFGVLLGGAMVIETIFNWPGIGKLVVVAIYGRDFPLVQAVILAVATVSVLITLVVDLIYLFIDPRVRYN